MMSALTDFARAVLFDFPLAIVKAILSICEKKDGKAYLYMWVASIVLSGAILLLAVYFKRSWLISQWSQNPKNLLPLLVGFYLGYVFMISPALIPYQYAKTEKFSNGNSKEKRFRFKEVQMFRARTESKPSMYVYGVSS